MVYIKRIVCENSALFVFNKPYKVLKVQQKALKKATIFFSLILFLYICNKFNKQ